MHKILALAALCLLTACAQRHDDRPRPTIHPIPKYEDTRQVQSYGPWFVNRCTLVGGNQDFSVSTTGQFERNTLRMQLQTNLPLTAPPQLRINVLDVPITTEGRNKTYGFNLPFAAYQVAKYANNHAYLFITYQPLGSTQTREGFLALNPLLSGLSALAKACD